MGDDCVFCGVAAGIQPAAIVYRDETTIAFLDHQPVTRGHTLVIPREHLENIYPFGDTQAADLMVTGARMARALKSAFGAAGVNFWMANERAAGQEVMHAHLHVIPRYPNDGFGIRSLGRSPAGRDQLEEAAAVIRAALESNPDE